MSKGAWAAILLVGCSQAMTEPPQIAECDAGAKCGKPGGPGGGSGTGGSAGDGGTSTCGDIAWSPAACEACMQQTCCGSNATCSSNAACTTIVACVSAMCPTAAPTCVSTCENASPNGALPYEDLASCMKGGCTAACSPADAGACGVFVFGVPACDACVGQTCCAEATTCSADPQCQALLACIQMCDKTNPACRMDCQTLYPNASFAYDKLAQCVVASCGTVCP